MVYDHVADEVRLIVVGDVTIIMGSNEFRNMPGNGGVAAINSMLNVGFSSFNFIHSLPSVGSPVAYCDSRPKPYRLLRYE